MLVRWPGKVKAGKVSNHICAFWDMLPTFCDLANFQSPEDIDGISILPALLSKVDEQKKHEFLYWEITNLGKQAVRMNNWKGIRLNINKAGFKAPVALYDLSKDISEENDVAAEHPEIVKKIKQIMKDSHVENPYFKFEFEK